MNCLSPAAIEFGFTYMESTQSNKTYIVVVMMDIEKAENAQ